MGENTNSDILDLGGKGGKYSTVTTSITNLGSE